MLASVCAAIALMLDGRVLGLKLAIAAREWKLQNAKTLARKASSVQKKYDELCMKAELLINECQVANAFKAEVLSLKRKLKIWKQTFSCTINVPLS